MKDKGSMSYIIPMSHIDKQVGATLKTAGIMLYIIPMLDIAKRAFLGLF